MSARIGRNRQIREYLTANPGKTAVEIGEAIGIPAKELRRGLHKAVTQGTLSSDGGEPRRYSLGRPVMVDFFATPEQKHRNRMERIRRGNLTAAERKRAERIRACAITIKVMAEPTPMYAPTVRAQTVEEWIAAGNQPEVIPVKWAAPDARRRVA